MRLHEVASLLGLKLEVEGHYHPDQDDRVSWTVRFTDVETLEGRCLTSICGHGTTPKAACRAYLKELNGKDLVSHAYYPDKRREFKLPAGVTP